MAAKFPKLYVLDNGSMITDKALFAGREGLQPYDPGRPDDYIEFPVYTVLIDHPSGMILFDAACRPLSAKEDGGEPSSFQRLFPCFADEPALLRSRLARLGIGPADIRFVVASHLHADHAGYLDLFSRSTILVHEDELEHAYRSYAGQREVPGYEPSLIESWVRADLNWRKIGRNAASVRLAEGVDVINLGGGHCPGLLGLRVRLPGAGAILLISDAAHTAVNYGPPAKLPGPDAVYDRQAYLRAIRAIRRIAEVDQAQVWFGHDGEQFRTLVKSDEGYYE